MGWLQRLRERIDPPREVADHEWVLLAVVPFSDGPMTHSAIEGAGIEAVLDHVRGTPPAHGFDRYRILVHQRDLTEAQVILDDLRGPG
jgi:hypothetical protein